MLGYGGGRALSPGVNLGSTSDYSNPAVGLDGNLYVTAPSNNAHRYAISSRSATPTEVYSLATFGFTPRARITQRISPPLSVAYSNAGSRLGYFNNNGDGTHVTAATLGITGTRGITWTGSDNGYGGTDLSLGLLAYKFDIGAASKTTVDSGISLPLSFIMDHAPGAHIYAARADGGEFVYIDTASDMVVHVASMSPVLANPLVSCIIATDGNMYGLRTHSGSNRRLERFSVNSGVSTAVASLGNPTVSDYVYESPSDGRLWVRMSLFSAVRMVGFNKTTLQIECFSEAIPDGVSSKIPIGFTSTGLLALTGTDGGNLVYYTLAT